MAAVCTRGGSDRRRFASPVRRVVRQNQASPQTKAPDFPDEPFADDFRRLETRRAAAAGPDRNASSQRAEGDPWARAGTPAAMGSMAELAADSDFDGLVVQSGLLASVPQDPQRAGRLLR